MKIFILLLFSFFLFSCSSFHIKKNSIGNNQDENINILDIKKIKYNYFTYVNLPKIVNMEPLNNESIDYLIQQTDGKETEFRLLVEKNEILSDNIKKALCETQDEITCNLNYHIYSGTKFGADIYRENSKNKNFKRIMLPLYFWSTKWINLSKEEASNALTICGSDKNCINNNVTNPISNIYANCLIRFNSDDKNFLLCLNNYFETTTAKDYFFIIGYLAGYNISYNFNNN